MYVIVCMNVCSFLLFTVDICIYIYIHTYPGPEGAGWIYGYPHDPSILLGGQLETVGQVYPGAIADSQGHGPHRVHRGEGAEVTRCRILLSLCCLVERQSSIFQSNDDVVPKI